MTNHFLTLKAPTEDGVESDAHMSLGYLTFSYVFKNLALANIVPSSHSGEHLLPDRPITGAVSKKY